MDSDLLSQVEEIASQVTKYHPGLRKDSSQILDTSEA